MREGRVLTSASSPWRRFRRAARPRAHRLSAQGGQARQNVQRRPRHRQQDQRRCLPARKLDKAGHREQWRAGRQCASSRQRSAPARLDLTCGPQQAGTGDFPSVLYSILRVKSTGKDNYSIDHVNEKLDELATVRGEQCVAPSLAATRFVHMTDRLTPLLLLGVSQEGCRPRAQRL